MQSIVVFLMNFTVKYKHILLFKYNIKMDDFHLELFTKQANILNLNSVYGLNIGLGIKYFLDN